MLEVVERGPLLTIQDAGRPGLGRLGIPPSGACDAWGLAVANLVVGADPTAPALEVTFGGCALLALESCAIGLGGADLGARLDDGRALAPGAAYRLPAGVRLEFGGSRWGLRAYVALAGGIETGTWMGSASTYGPGRLGFDGGRALVEGDCVSPRRPGDLDAVGSAWPSGLAHHPAAGRGPVTIVPGPDLGAAPVGALDALLAARWRVSPSSDRMGLRLEGASLGNGTEIVSHALLPGAVQVPPDGLPVVTLVDGPTIGGYPVLGVVPAVDLPRLGQLRPGDEIQFGLITPDAARALWRRQRALIERAATLLRADATWTRLADNAGG